MQEPFPHILTRPDSNRGLLRFVTDQPVGATIEELDNFGRHYNIFQVDTLKEIREAKGDWTNWPKHPTYYEGEGRFIGTKAKS